MTWEESNEDKSMLDNEEQLDTADHKPLGEFIK